MNFSSYETDKSGDCAKTGEPREKKTCPVWVSNEYNGEMIECLSGNEISALLTTWPRGPPRDLFKRCPVCNDCKYFMHNNRKLKNRVMKYKYFDRDF